MKRKLAEIHGYQPTLQHKSAPCPWWAYKWEERCQLLNQKANSKFSLDGNRIAQNQINFGFRNSQF